MRRPVWLFSMDTEQFCAPPLTTGALLAYFRAHGATEADTDVDLVHFLSVEAVDTWLEEKWAGGLREQARAAVAAGVQPVLGLSCYTWNVAEFIDAARKIKADVPGVLVVAGGPHVQRAEDFLESDSIDVIALGEAEETFTGLLDAADRKAWRDVAGLGYFDENGDLIRTAPRGRSTELDGFPTAVPFIPLRDENGKPLYEQVAYETTRGCPYRCAFCEWGTGAIGTKMYQFSLERIRADLELLVAGGIKDVWLCDSNFGALREDTAKAELVIELREKTGLPQTFATSWSKNHNKRVQGIVRLLHRNDLLSHYHLALQTLTPLALELSNRKNMRANDYEPVVKGLAADGIPVAAELIWGLPGDTLGEFETNLDHLLTVFPNINIFGYTLLPGTEFYDRRDEYQLQTRPVAGYGKAKGEYVVGCHTFSSADGEEGYFLIGAYITLARGQIMPLTTQLLAQSRQVPVAPMLRAVLRALIEDYAADLPAEVRDDQISAYENRSDLFLRFLADPDRTYATIRRTIEGWLAANDAADIATHALRVLELDRALCPRFGEATRGTFAFDFAADRTLEVLSRMEAPATELLEASCSTKLDIRHPGGVGEILRDPDGGSWVRGQIESTPDQTSA
ncbi:MAG: cobalamin-dependent protein [Candidatus Binatia bacterium]|nr:cobalamin-dependent protein [Candidatus Binatia bacterium]